MNKILSLSTKLNEKIFDLSTLSWVASAFSLVGLFFSININILCWPIWTIANFIWIYISYNKKDKAQLLLWSVYTIVNFYGWVSWS